MLFATGAGINDDSIISRHIAASNVRNHHLEDEAVTAEKVAPSSLFDYHIAESPASRSSGSASIPSRRTIRDLQNTQRWSRSLHASHTARLPRHPGEQVYIPPPAASTLRARASRQTTHRIGLRLNQLSACSMAMPSICESSSDRLWTATMERRTSQRVAFLMLEAVTPGSFSPPHRTTWTAVVSSAALSLRVGTCLSDTRTFSPCPVRHDSSASPCPSAEGASRSHAASDILAQASPPTPAWASA
eukprot:jgi/Tetstr1/456890/TSEL_043560.t1